MKFRADYVPNRSLHSADEETVRRYQETGAKDCFAQLFAQYRKPIYFACQRFFSDVSAAEDATQETFLRAFRNIDKFQGGDFSNWLMRIAKNVCIDLWRKRRLEFELIDPELIDRRADLNADPSSFETRITAQRVLREIRSLPPEQRRCLELKVEGYSYEETAARTGLSIDAVKSHLQNGRRMLWRKLGGMSPQTRAATTAETAS
jgi:RNA polymerase sigma-70 factor, ECF subfamily